MLHEPNCEISGCNDWGVFKDNTDSKGGKKATPAETLIITYDQFQR